MRLSRIVFVAGLLGLTGCATTDVTVSGPPLERNAKWALLPVLAPVVPSFPATPAPPDESGDYPLPAAGGMIVRALPGIAVQVDTPVIVDFWAAWCGPCRAQHGLYEQVKEKFKGRNDVEFVYLNTDEDKSLVAPFLDAQKWSKKVFFEDGLSRLLNVSSIPTTIILNKRGEIATRMNGFVPETFVGQLSERVQRILTE